MSKEIIIINGASGGITKAVTAGYGKFYAASLLNFGASGTFIMEREMKEYEIINPSRDETELTVKANYGRMSYANAVHTGTRKATFIMEKETAEPQVLRMERTEEEKRRRHAEGDKGAKFSAAKEMKPRQDGVANTLTSSTKDNLVCEKWRIRKLTPVETGRLMGLEDTEIQKMIDAGIPKTQLYKLHGNSIVVDVLENIFRKMFIDTRNENRQLELF